jgi:uncharacterized protein YerC
VLRELKSSGSIAKLDPMMAAWDERHDLLGMHEIQALEQRYGVAENARVGLKS